jgi:integrase
VKQKPEEKGIYRKGGKPGLWLRYSFEGFQVRVPLHTRDFAEAIEIAKTLRGQPPKAKEGDPEFGWTKAIDRYLAEKQQAERPAGFHGKTWRTFRPGTVGKVRSCLVKFANWTGTKAPQQVTKTQLEAYRDLYAKKSLASARTTMAQILAFFEHVGIFHGRIQLPEKRKLERREIVVSIAEGNALIEAAPTDRLRFVLFCGFHAGLRRGEIMHARPFWFQLSRGILRVPRVDEIGENRFAVKDSETRDIPLSAAFADFMKRFLEGVKPEEYCLRNPTKRRSKDGTYDFRRPFSDFVSVAGHPGLFPHAMRHSWITELCNSGNHSIQEVAAWSGDSLETIERNYWHKRATPGALDETMRGIRKGSEQVEMMKQIATQVAQLVAAGKIDTGDVPRAIEQMLERAEGDSKTLEKVLKKVRV